LAGLEFPRDRGDTDGRRDVTGRDWLAWYEQYDDPSSSLSRRLEAVREQLARALAERASGPVSLLSLCAGDGRDTLPVLASLPADRRAEVRATLVELHTGLADAGRRAATGLGLDVDVRVGDAGLTATWADTCPVDVLMLCGVFGNVADAGVAATVAALPSLLVPGAVVLWTRGRAVEHDPTTVAGDPAEWVRSLFVDAGFVEEAFVAPSEAGFRVGAHCWTGPTTGVPPERLFAFV
jgi:hypothetical protein